MTKLMNSRVRLLNRYNHRLQIVIDDFTHASCTRNGEIRGLRFFAPPRIYARRVGVRINLSRNILFIARRLSQDLQFSVVHRS